jgi:hypothetical protein
VIAELYPGLRATAPDQGLGSSAFLGKIGATLRKRQPDVARS